MNEQEQIPYPYSPEAQWRFAVSRRFNHRVVDDLYFAQLHPILLAHGIVMECRYAGDCTKDLDFWMTRMSILFEIADIHLLIDIDRSDSLDWEFDRSRKIVERRHSISLTVHYGWAPHASSVLFSPVRIFIRSGTGEDRPPTSRQAGITYYSGPADRTFSKRLSEQLARAQRLRSKALSNAQQWFGKKLTIFSFLDDELRATLKTMTQMANMIVEHQDVEGALAIAQDFGNTISCQDTNQLRNERQLWWRDVLAGKVLLPTSFKERRKMLTEYFHEGLVPVTGRSFVYSKPVTSFLTLAGFVAAIKLRKYAARSQRNESDSRATDPRANMRNNASD